MKDIQNQISRLEMEIADCELIAKMAVDPNKRELFKRLAEKYSLILGDLRATLRSLDAANAA